MKEKMSITVDEEKIRKIEECVRKGEFRNKSHALEQGIDILFAAMEANKNEQL